MKGGTEVSNIWNRIGEAEKTTPQAMRFRLAPGSMMGVKLAP
jgi:hypothetical protein